MCLEGFCMIVFECFVFVLCFLVLVPDKGQIQYLLKCSYTVHRNQKGLVSWGGIVLISVFHWEYGFDIHCVLETIVFIYLFKGREFFGFYLCSFMF